MNQKITLFTRSWHKQKLHLLHSKFLTYQEEKRDITGAFVRVSASDECRQSRLAAAQLAGWLSSLAATTTITNLWRTIEILIKFAAYD